MNASADTSARTSLCPAKQLWTKLNRQISPSKAHLLFWSVFIVGLISDLWSKSAVFNWLSSRDMPNFSIIDGFFRLVLVENKGAAWGIAQGRTMPLIVISIIAVIVVFVVFLFLCRRDLLAVLALAFLAAGILGNLYDRIFNDGKVRDFLDFYYADLHFPAFNIADSMLTVAVFLLILITIFSPKT